MPGNPDCTVFVGNLDEKVDDRLLYEIMIQAGPVVDMYIPRDKETNRHKGYGFTEYESEENAQYAIKLFTGLVCLHNKTLRFAISGQDKVSPNKQSADGGQEKHSHNQKAASVTKSVEFAQPSEKQRHSHSRQLPAQENSYSASPPISAVPSYLSAHNSHGAIRNDHNVESSQHSSSYKHYSYGALRNGHNLENTQYLQSCKYDSLENIRHSRSYNYNSRVIEERRFDSHLKPTGRIGSGYAFAYPSY